MMLLKKIVNRLNRIYNLIWYRLYPLYRAPILRRKPSIKVVFVVNELAPWKTIRLYKAMRAHERFDPIVGIGKSIENVDSVETIRDYCNQNDITCVVLDENRTICAQTNADIIVYQKPYMNHYPQKHQMNWNRKAMLIYVLYGIHSIEESWTFSHELFYCSWQYYYENELAVGKAKVISRSKGRNIRVTGIPIMDEFLQGKEAFANPWKLNSEKKKKIIYAPHCSIGDQHLQGLAYSTFLEKADFMLELAKKYENTVNFAFKPHPLLYQRLIKVWGQKKTDWYYNQWKSLENTQYENGPYLGLFMHSDAMIHDCSSFTIEYLYTHNPVLYLSNDSKHSDNQNPFARKAYDLHYKAYENDEIEQFVVDVIDGRDEKKNERECFFKNYLVPPNGKTACENIMNSILGIAEYS